MDFQTAFNFAMGAFGGLCLFVLAMVFRRIDEAKAEGVREGLKAAAAAETAKAAAEAAREAAVAALEEERKGREKDRHDLRDEINKVGSRLGAFMLEVAKECINAERLSAALEPMANTLAEIKSDQREIFKRLDGKVDKP